MTRAVWASFECSGQARLGIQHHPRWLITFVAMQANRQFRVVLQGRFDADQDSIVAAAQFMDAAPRLLARDPTAFARGRGDLAVQGGGKLQGYGRAGHYSEPVVRQARPRARADARLLLSKKHNVK